MITIKAKNKAEFEALKVSYRSNGYNFITFGKKLVEMEKGDMIIRIIR